MKKLKIVALFLVVVISLSGCKKHNPVSLEHIIKNKKADTIEERYYPPVGYKRVPAEKDSIGYFLRHEKLKPYGSKSLYYNGKEKENNDVYDSVFDIDLEGKNLLHCADACYKFVGDYLYSQKRYDEIKFKFVSNGVADFKKYTMGYRVNPETGQYSKLKNPSDSINTYKKFMDVVYGYCSTISLKEDTIPVNIDDIQIGDIFVRDGVPGTKRVGHAIMVVDMAINKKGHKVFMLAQSYMPAQQTQILVNRNDKEISPWYSLDNVKKMGELKTPQWTFELDQLRKFKNIK